MTILYGIKNCDTVRTARRWLEARDIDYRFHDFRTDGLSAAQIAQWLDALGTDALINRRSRTWKQLPEAQREGLDHTNAQALLLDKPTLIKRPLLDTGQALHTGFDEDSYRTIFHTD